MKDNRIYVKDSPIHGKGVFAARKLKPGEFIGRYIARKVKRDSRYVLWVADEGSDKYVGYMGVGRMRFLNHSAFPNAALGNTLDFFAIRPIAKDEEITFHYGDEWHESLPGERDIEAGSNATDAELALIERVRKRQRRRNGNGRA